LILKLLKDGKTAETYKIQPYDGRRVRGRLGGRPFVKQLTGKHINKSAGWVRLARLLLISANFKPQRYQYPMCGIKAAIHHPLARLSSLLRLPNPSQEKGGYGKSGRYIIQASFSQERMTYLQGKAQIIYRSNDYQPPYSFMVLD